MVNLRQRRKSVHPNNLVHVYDKKIEINQHNTYQLCFEDVRPVKIKMGHKSTHSVCVVSGLDCV